MPQAPFSGDGKGPGIPVNAPNRRSRHRSKHERCKTVYPAMYENDTLFHGFMA